MNLRKLSLAVLLCLLVYSIPTNIFSDDIKKANKYYEKYDYKFAIEIYEKIMQKKPTLEVAQKLANCYRFINDTKAAEKAYADVLAFPDFDPANYKYYADALKQNGKFEEAKKNYLSYGKNVPAKADAAEKLANSCDAARIWTENPDKNITITGEAKLNTEYSEFSPVNYNNSYVFVSDRLFVEGESTKKNKEVYGWTGNPYLKLYEAGVDGNAITQITILPKNINADYHNGPAVFTKDGNEVYFTRTDFKPTNKRKNFTIGKKKIFYTKRSGENWEEAKLVPFNPDASYSVQHPALSPDGTILYFSSDKPGGQGGIDIYASRKKDDGTWGEPVNCGPEINTADDEVFPVVKADGKFYFSSRGHVGMGGLDLFSAEGSYNAFKAAENMKAPMNSTKDDFGILFKNDTAGYLSSNRDGGRGLDDIYQFIINPVKPEKLIFAVEGDVIEQGTKAPLEGMKIFLVNKTTGKDTSVLSDAQGKFRFELGPEMDYMVRGDTEKFFSRQEGEITTKGLKISTIFNVTFELEKAGDELIVKLNTIYYDFDKYNIRRDAVPELGKVVNFMNKMPNISIELRSHTDARGPAVYNQWLSQKRAESAVTYLKNSGISSGRLSAQGFGETQLINRCADGVVCTRAEHQLNRRTEFKVVKAGPVAKAD